MKKFFKWFGIILGGLILLIIIILFVMKFKIESRMAKVYSINITIPVIPTDSASLALGKHWANVCTGCHRYDFAGTSFFSDPKLGTINAPNLTPGKGGVGKILTDKDWVLAIRHGIKNDGHPIMIMPSNDFNNLGEKEVACIVAYMKTIPPIDLEWDQPKLTFLAKILAEAGAFGDFFTAEVIDHSKGFEQAPPVGSTIEYGNYLVKVSGCRHCHGLNLVGGKDPNPAAPPVPGITSAYNVGKWKVEDFIKTIRTGQTPEGKALNFKFMPWNVYGKMNDTELTALYAYLNSLPGKK